MNTNPIPFAFDDHLVRVIVRDGDPWFVAADVAKVLEIGRTDDAVRRLDDDEKDTIRTPGGPQEMTIINESGLYSLILTSRKPAAKRFKKWVTSEVLPSIRKTGSYAMPGAVAGPEADAFPPVADIPERTQKLWLDKIALAYRIFGRAASKELWRHAAAHGCLETVPGMVGGQGGRAARRRLPRPSAVPAGDGG